MNTGTCTMSITIISTRRFDLVDKLHTHWHVHDPVIHWHPHYP